MIEKKDILEVIEAMNTFDEKPDEIIFMITDEDLEKLTNGKKLQ